MIARLNPKSRSDEYGRRINRDHSTLLAYSIPWLTILIGSLLPTLPIATGMPFMPPFGFLLLICWRFVRPGLLPVWVGLPLGAFDDLFSGNPFGSAILLWSLTMIALDLIEARFPWRGFAQDWFTATAITLLYLLAAFLLSGAPPTIHALVGLVPQILLTALLFPVIARLVAALDRLRLLRVRAIG